ncbi:MAG TPA: TatD family hydrolase, partial [Bacillota bacterium]|nr:TatD family hydrolase [Bacillota bacterium]
MWIDTHCHLNDPVFREDYPAVIERARQSGIDRLVVVGFDMDSSQEAVRLAGEYEMVYAAVGIHPHDAKTWTPQAAETLRRLLGEAKVVALGEIGLDYYYDYSPRADQIEAFQAQLRIAK